MRIGMRTVKTVISVFASMVVANYFSLLFWPSAGIIALLSVGNTRRSTLMTGIYRIAAFIIATFIAFLCFTFLGYRIISFSVFLLFFIPIAVRFKLTEGIVVNSVLITHYLSEQSMSWQLIANEAALMMIGVGFALLSNVYMPDSKKRLKENQVIIEERFRQLLRNMADFLISDGVYENQGLCKELQVFIRESQAYARDHQENNLLRQNQYYETYFSMRRAQINVIQDMQENLEYIHEPVPYSDHIYGLLIYTAETFSESNDGKEILARIEEVYGLYRQMPLPTTRSEFEARAELFQFLQSFKSFIEIKVEFSQQMIVDAEK
ncbi:aromatic acid exporter family protein [Enterococcus sp. DIV1298c]|uniref:Putative aromatic acid exporter C-terminal domain-containing protein n=1 Tax=Candidatus Enterococcus mangumiae TaxID=2230878 RepID=A0ABZ2T3R4_9ENTE|nr:MULTISPECIES: aromatic acid exporter family protein [unclassified Enterococcus]MBO0460391.1 aromatic acid exporter family protein [Enterococcus sp. DIV1298c]MBO0490771.1 aromatic acid exporter family protein [Enterococcus sp. DIV1094]